MADHLNANGTETKVCNLQCIDLSNPDIHQSAALIKQACLDTGMFYVINHGISNEVMDEAFAQSKKFFGMPESEKMKILWNKNHRGYQPPVQKDYVESYTAGVRAHEDDPTNIWPPTDILPRWKEAMQRYQRETFNVGKTLMKLVALALNLDIDYFNQQKMLGKDTASICTILHYGDQESDSTKEKLGAVGHTDAGLLTLVATDDIVGLEVCRDKYSKPEVWECILPKKRAFIVNVGDMLQRLSNDSFRSIFHRVVHREDRYSIAVFLIPAYDCVIECLPGQKSKENPSMYSPITFRDFVNSRFMEVATGEPLNSIENANIISSKLVDRGLA
ncbi:2-oxoglutarate (2OG) and Fe(II)-dependent oxygenase superfamily protein [Melia azedarach]|uniref:2-oxoglutarate (2OG) and Fe(II)-dependent oxygenase superfamily protein n=1 Tax=Melia azedarach TaxID=155640 RepID=A0ACC1XSA1_MELAZ|nr:2-oxoglutarate (2OG) and Fe(II)-dependent oxygenase superfamily protein [Melia azedarach]